MSFTRTIVFHIRAWTIYDVFKTNTWNGYCFWAKTFFKDFLSYIIILPLRRRSKPITLVFIFISMCYTCYHSYFCIQRFALRLVKKFMLVFRCFCLIKNSYFCKNNNSVVDGAKILPRIQQTLNKCLYFMHLIRTLYSIFLLLNTHKYANNLSIINNKQQ
jgi:hypothetical protein